jgi:hypothetical protein
MKWIAVITYQSWASCNQENTMSHPVHAPTEEGALQLAKDYFGKNIAGTLVDVYVRLDRAKGIY